MRAFVLRAPAPVEKAPLQFVNVAVPEPGPGEVLIRVHACGICRTDLHVIEGELTPRLSPVIPGHQVVGVVESCGTKTSLYTPGARVGVAWVLGLAACANSAARTESASEVHWATDDGSSGFHGTVVNLMRDLYARRPPGFVHVIGPVPLMRTAAELTRQWGVPTMASLNPIMLDGTGMCGGCRVSVGGESRFACMDGPEFDAHLVDFDQLATRNRAYLTEEKLENECST